MTSKTIFLLAVSALAGFASAVFLSSNRDSGAVVQVSATLARTATAPTRAEPEDLPAGAAMLVSAREPADRQAGGDESLEQALVNEHSLLTARLRELEDDDKFRELLAELREERSAIAAGKRRTYELLFYSQPLIRSADVTVDALECGTRFCVAEFRANDPAVLGRFTKNLLTAKEFEAGATVGFGAEATPAGMTQRLLFSHDPSINSITVSPGTLLPAAIDPADEPPVIQ